tara:strand:- start:250 stop:468 length:219 start_codon:yes stop_codon:yes gene_type:complete
MNRKRISHWRIWVMLTNKEKAELYPKLKPSEIKRIWTKEYMKVIRYNCYPHAFKEKYDARFAILNNYEEHNN